MTPAPDWTAFDWLIAPLDRATFLEEVWDVARRPSTAPIPGTSARSSVAPTSTRSPGRSVAAGEADQQLQDAVVRFIDGEPQSEPVVADADGSPNLYQLYRSHAAGWSVILASLSERWPPITSLCARLETALHHPMTACLYSLRLSRGSQRTTTPLMCSSSRSKAPRRGGCIRRVASSLRRCPAPLPHPVGGLLQDVRLDAGDVLYVPVVGYTRRAHRGSIAARDARCPGHSMVGSSD